jgi:hypothetical protein
VSDELAAELGNVAYIDEGSISLGRRDDHKHGIYVCVGFPNSQNKDMHASTQQVNIRMWMHSARGHSTNDKIGAWAATTQSHLFIEFAKYASNSDGSKRNSTEPRGTSGGPVFYLGDFGDPDIYRHDANFRSSLDAIIIEKSSEAKVLVAVRINTILQVLRNSDLLPSVPSRRRSF